MRENLPVTQQEVTFDPNANLLSTTHPDSIITYANQDFCDIAGYSEEELIGQPHNIVRHPDMPPEAFSMMWDRLKNGKSWMGLVKNRCKNGDHYWVKAYATPIQKDGETIEIQSIRTKPVAENLRRAEKLYAQLRQGKKPAFLKSARLGLIGKSLLLVVAAAVAATTVMAFTGAQIANVLLTLALSLPLVAAGMVWLLKPIMKAVETAAAVTSDPLAMHVFTGRNDEAGQLLLAIEALRTEANALVGRIRDDVVKLKSSNDSLVGQVRESNQNISDLNSQAEQVSAAIGEMSTTIHLVSDNCASAADAAQNVQSSSNQGLEMVRGSAESIKGVASDIHNASKAISNLEKNSESINAVVDVIRSVAEQTNLLALNAAIEAARAGEQGRGFAVVADEVRTLATRTHESTEEITSMITQLQSGTQSTVQIMQAAEESASFSVEKAAEAEDAIADILQSVDAITDMSQQIATAAEEQSAVASEIAQNISVVADLSQSLGQGIVTTEKASDEVELAFRGLQAVATQFFEKNIKR